MLAMGRVEDSWGKVDFRLVHVLCVAVKNRTQAAGHVTPASIPFLAIAVLIFDLHSDSIQPLSRSGRLGRLSVSCPCVVYYRPERVAAVAAPCPSRRPAPHPAPCSPRRSQCRRWRAPGRQACRVRDIGTVANGHSEVVCPLVVPLAARQLVGRILRVRLHTQYA